MPVNNEKLITDAPPFAKACQTTRLPTTFHDPSRLAYACAMTNKLIKNGLQAITVLVRVLQKQACLDMLT